MMNNSYINWNNFWGAAVTSFSKEDLAILGGWLAKLSRASKIVETIDELEKNMPVYEYKLARLVAEMSDEEKAAAIKEEGRLAYKIAEKLTILNSVTKGDWGEGFLNCYVDIHSKETCQKIAEELDTLLLQNVAA